MLHHIATKLHSSSPESANAYLNRALHLLQPALAHTDTHRSTFLCGAGGPFAIGAVLYSKLKESAKAKECVDTLCQLYTEHKSSFVKLPSELLVGQCGYLYALLFVKAYLPQLIQDDIIAEVATVVLDIGEQQKEPKYSAPVMYTWHGKHYLGAAHGLTGILTLLLQVHT